MPPKCTICQHSKLKEIDALLGTETAGYVASKFHLSKSTVARHDLEHRRGAKRPQPTLVVEPAEEPPPELPKLAPDAGPKEVALAHVKWLHSRLEWATRRGAGEKDLAQLAGQYTNAQRHYARLSGALDITESQVARSAPFQRALAKVVAAVEPWPEAVLAVQKALRDAEESGS